MGARTHWNTYVDREKLPTATIADAIPNLMKTLADGVPRSCLGLRIWCFSIDDQLHGTSRCITQPRFTRALVRYTHEYLFEERYRNRWTRIELFVSNFQVLWSSSVRIFRYQSVVVQLQSISCCSSRLSSNRFSVNSFEHRFASVHHHWEWRRSPASLVLAPTFRQNNIIRTLTLWVLCE